MIQLEKLGYFLPQGYLFEQVSLQVNRGDKIGLVGKNGAGKSTMLKLLSGHITPSEGAIHQPKGLKYGYLTQDIVIKSNETVYNYLFLSNLELNRIRERLDIINHELVTRTDYESDYYAGILDELSELNHEFQVLEGFQWEEKIKATLDGLGFSDLDQQKLIQACSGGWKMRAELARILVNNPDILLLDEPTNHLDIISISWLENYLQRFDGAVILISHDRLFLDNVTKRTLEISQGRVLDFPFAYSKYKLMRAEEMERMEQSKKQQDKQIKQTEQLIEKFRAKSSKASFAQSLMKKLEKTERIEVEKDVVSKIKLTFPLSVHPGKWVLEMNDLSKSYGDRTLFESVNITVGRGEKIALLGPNGVGKSTLLKSITKEIDYEGEVLYGHNVNVAYFAQDQAEKLDPNKTIYETVDDIAVGDIRKDLRSILGTFLFTGEVVEKKVSVLSGGERTRLALCVLLLSPSNFLILDEPTNHLDLQSKDVLKRALQSYEGTFVVVSHDREFLDGLCNRIWDIENRNLKIHHFTLNEYLQYKMSKKDLPTGKVTELVKEKVVKVEKPVQEKKPTNVKVEKEIQQIERKIEESEKRIEEMEAVIATLVFDETNTHTEVLNEYDSTKQKLSALMADWELKMSEL
jgi:ATP-binding cassette subfamily F protein 3